MVQARTLEKFKAQSPEIAQETGTDPEEVIKVLEAVAERIKKNQRQPREPIPEGGISIREAARKYKRSHCTILLWIKKGKIKVIKRTLNWTYIKEISLTEYLNSKTNGAVKHGKRILP